MYGKNQLVNNRIRIALMVSVFFVLLFVVGLPVSAKDLPAKISATSTYASYGQHEVNFTAPEDGLYKFSFSPKVPDDISIGYAPLLDTRKTTYADIHGKNTVTELEYLMKKDGKYRFSWYGDSSEQYTVTLTCVSLLETADLPKADEDGFVTINKAGYYKMHFDKPGYYRFYVGSIIGTGEEIRSYIELESRGALLDCDFCEVPCANTNYLYNDGDNVNVISYVITDTSVDYYLYLRDNCSEGFKFSTENLSNKYTLQLGENVIKEQRGMYEYTVKNPGGVIRYVVENKKPEPDSIGFIEPFFYQDTEKHFPDTAASRWPRAYKSSESKFYLYTNLKDPDYTVYLMKPTENGGVLKLNEEKAIDQKTPKEGKLTYYSINMGELQEGNIYDLEIKNAKGTIAYLDTTYKFKSGDSFSIWPYYPNDEGVIHIEIDGCGAENCPEYRLAVVSSDLSSWEGAAKITFLRKEEQQSEIKDDTQNQKKDENQTETKNEEKKEEIKEEKKETVTDKTSPEETTESIKEVTEKKTSLSSAKNKNKKSVTVLWKANLAAHGYEVQYALDKKFKKSAKTKTVKSSKQTSLTIKKLKKGKIYYVRVRAYVLDGSKKVYGKWSSKKKIKIKK